MISRFIKHYFDDIREPRIFFAACSKIFRALSRCCFVCVAVATTRSSALLGGTAGETTELVKRPLLKSSCHSVNAFSSSHMITGTIGVCVLPVSRPISSKAFFSYAALSQSCLRRCGSCCIISMALEIEATGPGGSAAEKIIERDVWRI